MRSLSSSCGTLALVALAAASASAEPLSERPVTRLPFATPEIVAAARETALRAAARWQHRDFSGLAAVSFALGFTERSASVPPDASHFFKEGHNARLPIPDAVAAPLYRALQGSLDHGGDYMPNVNALYFDRLKYDSVYGVSGRDQNLRSWEVIVDDGGSYGRRRPRCLWVKYTKRFPGAGWQHPADPSEVCVAQLSEIDRRTASYLGSANAVAMFRWVTGHELEVTPQDANEWFLSGWTRTGRGQKAQHYGAGLVDARGNVVKTFTWDEARVLPFAGIPAPTVPRYYIPRSPY